MKRDDDNEAGHDCTIKEVMVDRALHNVASTIESCYLETKSFYISLPGRSRTVNRSQTTHAMSDCQQYKSLRLKSLRLLNA